MKQSETQQQFNNRKGKRKSWDTNKERLHSLVDIY